MDRPSSMYNPYCGATAFGSTFVKACSLGREYPSYRYLILSGKYLVPLESEDIVAHLSPMMEVAFRCLVLRARGGDMFQG